MSVTDANPPVPEFRNDYVLQEVGESVSFGSRSRLREYFWHGLTSTVSTTLAVKPDRFVTETFAQVVLGP